MAWQRSCRAMTVLVSLLLLAALAPGCGRLSHRVAAKREPARETAAEQQAAPSADKGAGAAEKNTPEAVADDEGAKSSAGGGAEEVTGSYQDEDGHTTTWSASTQVTEADIGLAFYPGATVEHGGAGTSEIGAGGSWAVASLTTSDPMDQVIAFYKAKYAEGNQVVEVGEAFHIIIPADNGGQTITVTREADEDVTRILLSSGSR